MSKKNDENSEPPGLEDISELFPPSAPASLSPVANMTMKFLLFGLMQQNSCFAQADAQFAIGNVLVSKTKFYHAVVVLPQEVASQILDLIHAPPVRDLYEVLREPLITL